VSEFIGRAQAGIAVIADIDEAAFRAQPAAGANAHPGSNAGTIVCSQYLTDAFDINRSIRIVLKLKFLLSPFQFRKVPHFFFLKFKHEIRNTKHIPNSNFGFDIFLKAFKPLF
jgi:hypothetical protein